MLSKFQILAKMVPTTENDKFFQMSRTGRRYATAVDDSWHRAYKLEQTGVVHGATGNTETTPTMPAVYWPDNVPNGSGLAENRTGDPRESLFELAVTCLPTTPDSHHHLPPCPDELLDLGRAAARILEVKIVPTTTSGPTSRSS